MKNSTSKIEKAIKKVNDLAKIDKDRLPPEVVEAISATIDALVGNLEVVKGMKEWPAALPKNQLYPWRTMKVGECFKCSKTSVQMASRCTRMGVQLGKRFSVRSLIVDKKHVGCMIFRQE